jgi:uncharacterized protein YerC
MKSISNDKENLVVQLLSQDLSVHKVAAQVGVSIATISCVMKKHDLDHTAKPGWPQIISDTDKQKSYKILHLETAILPSRFLQC